MEKRLEVSRFLDNDCSTMVRAKAPNTIDPLLKSNQRPISSYTTLKFVYHIDSRRREKSVEPLQSCLRAENRISDNLFCSKSWREAWSSGSGWWLMFERSWGWILVLYTRWTFFTLICCINCIDCLKRPIINKK